MSTDPVPGPTRTFDQLRALLWLGVVPLVALLLLPFLLIEIGPSYEARFGGTPGTFTSRTSDCEQEGACRWTGGFRSDDGRVQRDDVRLIGGSVDRAGQSVAAVDVGAERAVYPGGGGWNWLITTVLLVVVAGVLAIWGRAVRRRLVARRLSSAGG